MTRPYTRWIEDSPDTLDAGTWTLDPRTRVLRWVADPDAPAAYPDLELVVCPCGAKVTEGCRTRSGKPIRHRQRTHPRLCACGTPVAPKRSWCDDCADERQRMRQKTWHDRKREAA